MRILLVLALAAALAAEGGPAPALTVATWNLLADPVRPADRSAAIVDHLVRVDADIIVLQEVAPWLRGGLLAEPRLRTWRSTVIDGRSLAPGGLFVLSRHPITASRIAVIPSRLDRVALVTDIDVGGRALRVVNVHLDSLLDQGEVRALQLQALREPLLAGDDVLLAGDCNFGDGEPEAAAVPEAFIDLWRALRPREPGLTFDLERNPLARRNALEGERSRRLDRLFLRSRTWRGESVAILGDAAVSTREPELFPSDHFGVAARLVGR